MPDGPAAVSIIVFDGRFERVHYALATAAAALATNRRATLLFTGTAVKALQRDGWRRLGSETGEDAVAVDDRQRRLGVAGFHDLMSACVELGARIIACEMGLRAAGVAADTLDPDLPIEHAGLATFLADAEPGGTTLFI